MNKENLVKYYLETAYTKYSEGAISRDVCIDIISRLTKLDDAVVRLQSLQEYFDNRLREEDKQ